VHVYLVHPSRAAAARRAAARPGRRVSTAPFASRCHGCCAPRVPQLSECRKRAFLSASVPAAARSDCRAGLQRGCDAAGGVGWGRWRGRCPAAVLLTRAWQGCISRAPHRVHARGTLQLARRRPPDPGPVSPATEQPGLQGTWPAAALVDRHRVTARDLVRRAGIGLGLELDCRAEARACGRARR